MGQESLFEGIVRSLKKNAGWAILIIALAVSASFLINRFAPSLYKSSSLIRVMTTAEMSEKDIAAEMNGVLAQKEVQEEIINKCHLDRKFVKPNELANLSSSGSGLLTLTVKYQDPTALGDINTAVIQILSERFLGYSAETREFTAKALQRKMEHLEKTITQLRKELITSSSHETWQNNSEVVDLENKVTMLEEKIDMSSKLLQTTPRKVFYYAEEESPQYKSVKKQLNVARNELAELYKSYKEKHPKVIACQNNIKDLEYRLSKASTRVRKEKNNPDYLTISADIQNDKQQLDVLKEELITRKKLAAANFSSASTEGLNLRIAALEELHRKTIIDLEESKISQNTTSGRINVLKKDHLPPQAVGFTAIQRDCLALLSGVLISIFLLYTPAPMKTEIIGVSPETLAQSLGPQLELGLGMRSEAVEEPKPILAEPAEIILEVPPLVSEPLSLPCLVTEEEVLSLKYDERLVSLNEPTSEILKPYKNLVSNLQISISESQTRIVIASSSKSGTGKTTMIANVAVLLAQAGYSVLLIDANFRSPSIHRMFGLDNVKGLSNLLNGEKPYDIIQKSPVENLSIISSGIMPKSPEEALGSTDMIKLLGNLKRRMEIILIDTPALLDYPETAVLAGQTGAVVFLHREGESEEFLKESKRILNDVRARVFGYVKI
ncbi:MAG: polysaccharide biosynthesis tyrosine autokinase [Candidatus Riflebacteria bacterium]|nr:polysaccharide biosynthesis tyrosine autokinase [Candidatus Riflebacteria bacterium]